MKILLCMERTLLLRALVSPHVWKPLLPWYFVASPLHMVRSFLAALRGFAEVFSFIFLLRTLFAPWKSITEAYPRKGFNLSAIAQTFTLNCTTRAIGFIIRAVTIVVGLLIFVLFVTLSAGFFLLWMTFPLLFVFGVAFLFPMLR